MTSRAPGIDDGPQLCPGTVQLATAAQLLNFRARPAVIDEHTAEEQLKTTVATYNMLMGATGFAYLADEVGMGKTFVALGVVALLRHWQPNARILIVAPGVAVQRKWADDYAAFLTDNRTPDRSFVRFPDMRNRAADGTPVRSLVSCENLASFARELNLDRHRDFLLRMTSFSLGSVSNYTEEMYRQLPWLPPSFLDGRLWDAKHRFGWALNALMPEFDLVIVDEAHNLKHGIDEDGVAVTKAARNNVLARALGSLPAFYGELDPHTGSRAPKVLLLSATPIEGGFNQLHQQLRAVGKADQFPQFADQTINDDERRDAARQFMLRRVRTTTTRSGQVLSRNQYRREWRAGGVERFDDPMVMTDPRERLTVALMQKKISEVLESKADGSSFQIGMLASFESFQRTAEIAVKVRAQADAGDITNFDDATQTRDAAARRGVDVNMINRLATGHRRKFGKELAHPKMDRVVRAIAADWPTGEKHLVFVRRVASVVELRRKVEESHDAWLLPLLEAAIPPRLAADWSKLVDEYHRSRARYIGTATERNDPTKANLTFYSWFFRSRDEGSGDPRLSPWFSGRDLVSQWQAGGWRGLLRRDNAVLRLAPLMAPGVGGPHQALNDFGSSTATLAHLLALHEVEVLEQVGTRAAGHLPALGQRATTVDTFDAIQLAAFELLAEKVPTVNPFVRRYVEMWSSALETPKEHRRAVGADRVRELIEAPTLVSALAGEAIFGAAVAPPPTDWTAASAESDLLRVEILSASLRHGLGLIDVFLGAVASRKSLLKGDDTDADFDDSDKAGTTDDAKEPTSQSGARALADLVRGAVDSVNGSPWGTQRELSLLGQHHELLAAELAGVRTDLGALRRTLGEILRTQAPIAGMFGAVNATAVRQFRWPVMPQVLITTDLLQEGVDLHHFCANIHHYGLAWTPTALEQRTGRIDRIGSMAERRIRAAATNPSQPGGGLSGEDHLQVFMPYLQDTVEILQMKRVLEASDRFLELMHLGLAAQERVSSKIDLDVSVHGGIRVPAQPRGRLVTAFPVRDDDLLGQLSDLAVDDHGAIDMVDRWGRAVRMSGGILDQEDLPVGATIGRIWLGQLMQVRLRLRHTHGHALTLAQVELPDNWLWSDDTGGRPVDFDARLAERVARQGLMLRKPANDAEGHWIIRGSVLLATAPHRDGPTLDAEIGDATRIGWIAETVAAAATDLLTAGQSITRSRRVSPVPVQSRRIPTSVGRDPSWSHPRGGHLTWSSGTGRSHLVWLESVEAPTLRRAIPGRQLLSPDGVVAVGRIATQRWMAGLGLTSTTELYGLSTLPEGSLAAPMWRNGKGLCMVAALPLSLYSAAETTFVLAHLAAEADRREFQLTGRDRF